MSKFKVVPSIKPLEWENRYQAALSEADRSKLPQKIIDAETAMFKRRLQLGDEVLLRKLPANAEDTALSNLVVLRNKLQS
jgi:hypothetical protein